MGARAFRHACRAGEFVGPTPGQAVGHVQANLVILPQSQVENFSTFCANNPAPCPLLEKTEPGVFEAKKIAPGSDLRSDLPRYIVWRDGVPSEELNDVTSLCSEQMQCFLLGCSFTWEDILTNAGLTPRHIEEARNVPMYKTSIPLEGAGPFQGNMVVSMRPYAPDQVGAVRDITARYPLAHGGPVHVGEPGQIGIAADALGQPHYGDAVSVRDGEVPVFWACGVTPQNVLAAARLPLAITHAPGHMFIADTLNEDLDITNTNTSGQAGLET